MELRVYLAVLNMSIKDFSYLVDCDPRYMSRIVNGHIVPGRRLAKDIAEMTDGKVKYKHKEKKKRRRISHAHAA